MPMSLISSSRWKGQVAGNSKKYWPSCPACRAHVLQICPLFNPNSPTNPMLTEWAVSSSGLLSRTVIHLLESCPSPWRPFCLEKYESALKLVVQHKISQKGRGRLVLAIFSPFWLPFWPPMPMSLISSSRWKGQVAGNSKKYWPSCPACRARVLQICPLFNPNSPTNPMLTEWAVSSSGLLWRTVIHLLESCPSPWRPFCLALACSKDSTDYSQRRLSRPLIWGLNFKLHCPGALSGWRDAKTASWLLAKLKPSCAKCCQALRLVIETYWNEVRSPPCMFLHLVT